MKKWNSQRIVRIVVIVCIAVFLICNVYLLNEKTLRGNALPMPLGFGTAIVLSGSMEPTLSVDDMILIVPSEDYAVGDVVVYQSGDALVVHRIVALEGDTVTTQGDANNAPDESMDLSRIKGKVVRHVDGIGRLVRGFKTPVVSFGMMGLAIFLLERSFRKDKQQNDDDIQKMEEEIRRLKKQTKG